MRSSLFKRFTLLSVLIVLFALGGLVPLTVLIVESDPMSQEGNIRGLIT